MNVKKINQWLLKIIKILRKILILLITKSNNKSRKIYQEKTIEVTVKNNS